MGFVTGSGSAVWMGQAASFYDLSQWVKASDDELSAKTLDTTCYGATAISRIGGILDGAANADGLYDPQSGAIDPLLYAALGDDTGYYLLMSCGTPNLGARFRAGLMKIKGNPLSTPVDNLIILKANWMPSAQWDAGDIVKAMAMETTGATQTYQDNGVGSANGGFLYVFVSGNQGTSPTLSGKLQHSTDHSFWSDLTGTTVTTLSGANGVAAYTVAAGTNVNRYVQWVSTAIGGSSTPGVNYAVAFCRR